MLVMVCTFYRSNHLCCDIDLSLLTRLGKPVPMSSTGKNRGTAIRNRLPPQPSFRQTPQVSSFLYWEAADPNFRISPSTDVRNLGYLWFKNHNVVVRASLHSWKIRSFQQELCNWVTLKQQARQYQILRPLDMTNCLRVAATWRAFIQTIGKEK